MASTSPNLNTGTTARTNVVASHNHQAPIPPARTHSRPNQPPPPPPLPSVPPVPPKRDSSIAISQAAIADSNNRHNTAASSIPQPQLQTNNLSDGANSHVIPPKQAHQPTTQHLNGGSRNTAVGNGDGSFVSQFASLFRPISEVPPPEPFMNRPKTYPSQRALQKQTITPRT